MALFEGLLNKVFDLATSRGLFTSPVIDHGDGTGKTWQGTDGAGNVRIAGVGAGVTVPVSGEVTAEVDTSALATQTTLASILTGLSSLATHALQTTLNALVTTPTIPSAITPSDDTNVATITAKGLMCTVAGTLQARGTGAPSTTVSIVCVAGQYVPLQCSRVMAATTGTYVGLS